MTYVYVLVSRKGSDLYYEQCLMSVASLRLHMPVARVVLLTDNVTDKEMTPYGIHTATECADGVHRGVALRQMASEVVVVPFADNVPPVDRSRLIKTSIPNYIEDNFLYIDCDTVICDTLEDVESGDYDVAGVLDGHCMLGEHIHARTFLQRDKRLGFSGTKAAGCNINGGVIFARHGAASQTLFREWNRLWCYSAYDKGDKHDQSALNEANRVTGLDMAHLSGEWNCQISHGGLAYLEGARIIHYYSSEGAGAHYIPYYKIGDAALQGRVGEAEEIPQDVMEMLRKPRFQLNAVHLVSDKRILSVMQSPLVFTLADIKAHLPCAFAVMECMAGWMRAVGKKVAGR